MRLLTVFLCIIVFLTKGFLRKLIASPLMQNGGVVSLKAPLREIIHNSPVLTAGQVKVVVHGLHTHQGLNSFFQLHQTEDGVLFYSHSLLPWKRGAPLNCKAGTAMREVRSLLLRGVSNCVKYFWIWSLQTKTFRIFSLVNTKWEFGIFINFL